MDILYAVVLSVVEGVTEFLPISSTGHMILVADLLKISETEFVKSFEIIIQLGAILAVGVLYIRLLLTNKALWTKLIAAFVPTGIVGLLLYKFIKNYLIGNTAVVLWSLFIGGIFLIVWEKFFQREISPNPSLLKRGTSQFENLSYRKAFIIGLFQSLSVVPGVSRAAGTIVGGMIVGLNRRAAVEFSFLLAVPTMAAATGLDLLKSGFSFNSNEWVLLGIGFAGAFITALITVKYFLKFVEKHTFVPFGVYRIVLALIFWLLIIK